MKVFKSFKFSEKSFVRNVSQKGTFDPEWLTKNRLALRKDLEKELSEMIHRITVADGYEIENPLKLIIADRTLKFKVVTACEKKWKQEIPSYYLYKIEYPKDILNWYLDYVDSKRKPESFDLPEEISNFIEKTESERKKRFQESNQ